MSENNTNTETNGRGKFIVLEGLDGAGKTTHLRLLAAALATAAVFIVLYLKQKPKKENPKQDAPEENEDDESEKAEAQNADDATDISE